MMQMNENKTNQSALRDHFAGLAMQAMLSNGNLIGAKKVDIARLAYKQADAMLVARGAAATDSEKGATHGDEWVSVLECMPAESGWYDVNVARTEFCGDGDGSVVMNDFWSADEGRWTLCGEVVLQIPCYVESVITHWRKASDIAPLQNGPVSDCERDELITALKKAQKNVSS